MTLLDTTKYAVGILQVGLSEFRTLLIDFTPALTLNCRRTYTDDSHRYSREEPQGEDLRPDYRCLYIGLALMASPQLQLDRFRYNWAAFGRRASAFSSPPLTYSLRWP